MDTINILHNLYKISPESFTEEEVNNLQLNLATRGIKLERDYSASDSNLYNSIKQFTYGYFQGFTTVDLGEIYHDLPKSPYEKIAYAVGNLLGFIGIIPGAGLLGKIGSSAIGKAVGLAKVGAKYASAGKAFKAIGSPALWAGEAISKGAITVAKKLAPKMKVLEYIGESPLLRTMGEDALKLGTASFIGATNPWELDIDRRMEAFLHGAIFGAGTASIGEAFAKKGKINIGEIFGLSEKHHDTANAIARAMSSALAFGSISTLSGAPTELQIYEYLLNAYFGYKSPTIAQREAMKIQDMYIKGGESYKLANPKKYVKEYNKLSKEAQEELDIQAELMWGAGNADLAIARAIEESQTYDKILEEKARELREGKISQLEFDAYFKDVQLYRYTEEALKEGKAEEEALEIAKEKTADDLVKMQEQRNNFMDVVKDIQELEDGEKMYMFNVGKVNADVEAIYDQTGISTTYREYFSHLAVGIGKKLGYDTTAPDYIEKMGEIEKNLVQFASKETNKTEDVTAFIDKIESQYEIKFDKQLRERLVRFHRRFEQGTVRRVFSYEDGKILEDKDRTAYEPQSYIDKIVGWTGELRTAGVEKEDIYNLVGTSSSLKQLIIDLYETPRKPTIEEAKQGIEIVDGLALYGGVKDKSAVLLGKFLIEKGDAKQIKEIVNEYKRLFPEDYSNGLKEWLDIKTSSGKKAKPRSEQRAIYEHLLANDIAFQTKFNMYDSPSEFLKDAKEGKGHFVIEPVAINKRKQIFLDHSPKYSSKDGKAISENLRFIILDDRGNMGKLEEDFNYYSVNGKIWHKAQRDGGALVREDVYRRWAEYFGYNPESSSMKGFQLGASKEEKGFLGKLAWHKADTKLSKWMKEHDIHIIHFSSTAKQKGKRKVLDWEFNENGLEVKELEQNIQELEKQKEGTKESVPKPEEAIDLLIKEKAEQVKTRFKGKKAQTLKFKEIEGLKNASGRRVGARYLRSENTIVYDLEKLKEDFENKAWTKPKVEGVRPLSEEAIPENKKEKIDISKSKKKSPYFAKDVAKFKKANKLIAFGEPRTSSRAYAEAVKTEQLNAGVYDANDIVGISVNGGKNADADVLRVEKELSKAIEAGSTIITDDVANRERPYNKGERAIAKFLENKGYQEIGDSGIWKPKKVIEKTSEPILNKEGIFETLDEWVDFVIEHELAHVESARKKGESLADYENRINERAMENFMLSKNKKEQKVKSADGIYELPWESVSVQSAEDISHALDRQKLVKQLIDNLDPLDSKGREAIKQLQSMADERLQGKPEVEDLLNNYNSLSVEEKSKLAEKIDVDDLSITTQLQILLGENKKNKLWTKILDNVLNTKEHLIDGEISDYEFNDYFEDFIKVMDNAQKMLKYIELTPQTIRLPGIKEYIVASLKRYAVEHVVQPKMKYSAKLIFFPHNPYISQRLGGIKKGYYYVNEALRNKVIGKFNGKEITLGEAWNLYQGKERFVTEEKTKAELRTTPQKTTQAVSKVKESVVPDNEAVALYNRLKEIVDAEKEREGKYIVDFSKQRRVIDKPHDPDRIFDVVKEFLKAYIDTKDKATREILEKEIANLERLSKNEPDPEILKEYKKALKEWEERKKRGEFDNNPQLGEFLKPEKPKASMLAGEETLKKAGKYAKLARRVLDIIDGKVTIEKPVQKQEEPKKTLRIYWGGKNKNLPENAPERILSNLAPRPFVWEGREYGSVEHAYQTNKSGKFDKEAYEAYNKIKGYGKKIRGKGALEELEKADNLELMKKLVVESFKQNPDSEASKTLLEYNDFVHGSSKIDKAFIEGLKEARKYLLETQQKKSLNAIFAKNGIDGFIYQEYIQNLMTIADYKDTRSERLKEKKKNNYNKAVVKVEQIKNQYPNIENARQEINSLTNNKQEIGEFFFSNNEPLRTQINESFKEEIKKITDIEKIKKIIYGKERRAESIEEDYNLKELIKSEAEIAKERLKELMETSRVSTSEEQAPESLSKPLKSPEGKNVSLEEEMATESLPDALKSKLEDLMEVVAIRTPADSPSAVRVLKFGGFTGVKGAGFMVHPEEYMAMGGADNDIDSAFFYWQLPKEIKDYYRQEHVRDQFFEKRYVDGDYRKVYMEAKDVPEMVQESPKLYLFSPYSQLVANIIAYEGNSQLGIGLATANRLVAVYDTLKRDKSVRKVKIGEEWYSITPRKDKEKFIKYKRAHVNFSADSADGQPTIPFEDLERLMFDSLFEVKGKKGKILNVLELDPEEFNRVKYRLNEIKGLRQADKAYKGKGDTLYNKISAFSMIQDVNSAWYGLLKRVGEIGYVPKGLEAWLGSYTGHWLNAFNELFTKDFAKDLRKYAGRKRVSVTLENLFGNTKNKNKYNKIDYTEKLRQEAQRIKTEQEERGRRISEDEALNLALDRMNDYAVNDLSDIVSVFLTVHYGKQLDKAYGKESAQRLKEIQKAADSFQTAIHVKRKLADMENVREEYRDSRFINTYGMLQLELAKYKQEHGYSLHAPLELVKVENDLIDYRDKLSLPEKKYFDALWISSLKYQEHTLNRYIRKDLQAIKKLENALREAGINPQKEDALEKATIEILRKKKLTEKDKEIKQTIKTYRDALELLKLRRKYWYQTNLNARDFSYSFVDGDVIATFGKMFQKAADATFTPTYEKVTKEVKAPKKVSEEEIPNKSIPKEVKNLFDNEEKIPFSTTNVIRKEKKIKGFVAKHKELLKKKKGVKLTKELEAESKKLAILLEKYPHLVSNLESEFIVFTQNMEGIGRTLDTITLPDLKAFNAHLRRIIDTDPNGLELQKIDYFLRPERIAEKHDLYSKRYVRAKNWVMTTEGAKVVEMNFPMSRLKELNVTMKNAVRFKDGAFNDIDEQTYEESNLGFIYKSLETFESGLGDKVFELAWAYREREISPQHQEFYKKIMKKYKNLLNRKIVIRKKNNEEVKIKIEDLIKLFDNEFSIEMKRDIKRHIYNEKETNEFLKEYRASSKIKNYTGHTDWIDVKGLFKRLHRDFMEGRHKYLGDYFVTRITKEYLLNFYEFPIWEYNPDTDLYTLKERKRAWDFNTFEERVAFLEKAMTIPKMQAVRDPITRRFMGYTPVVDQQSGMTIPAYNHLRPGEFTTQFLEEHSKTYLPWVGFPEKVYKERRRRLIEKAIAEGKSPREIARLAMEYIRRYGELNTSMDGMINTVIATSMTRKVSLQTLERAGFSRRSKHLLSRNYEDIISLDYLRNIEALVDYRKSFVSTYYDRLGALLGDYSIREFEKETIERKNKIGEKNLQGWLGFMRQLIASGLGYPSVLPDSFIDNPIYKIKGNPYVYFTDEYWVRKYLKFKNATGDREKLEMTSEVLNKLAWFSNMEGKFSLATLLTSPKTFEANWLTGNVYTIINTGFTNWRKAKDIKFLRNEINSEWKTMADVENDVARLGGIESFIRDFAVLSGKFNTPKLQEFLSDVLAKLRKDPLVDDRTIAEIAKKHGISQQFMEVSGYFMRKSERLLRTRAWLAHYLKAREILGANKHLFKWDDPLLVAFANKGVEATQFLYNMTTRPMFARTNLGKIFSRFQMFTYFSLGFRREIMEYARKAGYHSSHPAFDRYKRLVTADLFMMMLASVFPISVFSGALPPPLNWMDGLVEFFFGDKKQKERAFFGILPYPANVLQPVMPPSSRILTSTITALLTGEFDKYLSYHVITFFPFGRVIRDGYRSLDNPYLFLERNFGIPYNTFVKVNAQSKKIDRYQ